MTTLARREMLALAAAAVPAMSLGSGALATGRNASMSGLALVYDPSLREGQRFAARALELGTRSHAFSGDPVRQARAILGAHSIALFGISRASHHLIFSEVAREAGYEELVRIGHRAGCIQNSHCRPGAEAFAALARSSADHWPDAFAELALGASPHANVWPDPLASQEASSFSWVLRRKT